MQSNLTAYALDFMAVLTHNVIVSIKSQKCPKCLSFHLSLHLFQQKELLLNFKKSNRERGEMAAPAYGDSTYPGLCKFNKCGSYLSGAMSD